MGILPSEAEIMLCKSSCVVLVVLVLAAYEVSSASASGPARGSHPGGQVAAGCRTGALAYGNAYWCGSGWGWGYGYGYPGWGYAPFLAGYGYELVGVPYFAQFPPVYYGYEDNVPVLKAPIRSSWAPSEDPQPGMATPAAASPQRPPLLIVNPYYVEAKANQP